MFRRLRINDYNDSEIIWEVDRSIMMENYKLCPICNQMFEPYRPYQKYCSIKCRSKVKYNKNKKKYYEPKPSRIKRCKHCNKEFLTNSDKKIYCSPECQIEHSEKRKIEKETRFCLICDESFESSHWAKRYCSHNCYLEARRRRNEQVSKSIR